MSHRGPTPGAPRTSRRAFLAGSVSAAGSVLAGVPVAAPAVHRRRRPSDSLRVGLIGAGKRGHAHLRALGGHYDACEVCRARPSAPAPLEGAELVAVCDTFEDHRRRAALHLEDEHVAGGVFTDHRRMLDEAALDAVVVATPDHTHAPIAMDAARAGCDAYVEKCVANSVGEALELGRVLEDTGRLVQVGYQLRQDSMRRAARDIIEQGHLGQVLMVQDFVNRSSPNGAWQSRLLEKSQPGVERVDWPLFLGPAPWRPYDASRYFEWRKYWDYGTGICGDLLSHSLDSTAMVLDLPTPGSATASGGIHRWKDGREVPDHLTAAFEYPDRDLSVTFQCSLGSSYTGHMTRFMGTDATMELSWEIKVFPDANSPLNVRKIAEGEEDPHSPFIHIERSQEGADVKVAPSELWLQGKGVTVTTRDGVVMDTTGLHHREFLECVRTREQPSASFEASFSSTVGSLMAAQAFLQGRRVEWDPQELRLG